MSPSSKGRHAKRSRTRPIAAALVVVSVGLVPFFYSWNSENIGSIARNALVTHSPTITQTKTVTPVSTPTPTPTPRPTPRSTPRASRTRAPMPRANPGSAKAIAQQLMRHYGWDSSTQFYCLDRLYMRESGWNHRARNPHSGAYGIPQSLPASKMASAGADWRTNPETQLRWGLSYIKSRYGTPCGAWAFWQRHHWY